MSQVMGPAQTADDTALRNDCRDLADRARAAARVLAVAPGAAKDRWLLASAEALGHHAGMVLEAIMFNVFSVTIGGTFDQVEVADQAEELWDMIVNGIGAPR